jgi:hypothetical protein
MRSRWQRMRFQLLVNLCPPYLGAGAAGKVEPTFRVEIRDAQGEVVAEVEKLISVKRAIRGA